MLWEGACVQYLLSVYASRRCHVLTLKIAENIRKKTVRNGIIMPGSKKYILS